MTIQVLAVTMNQTDESLIKKMNLQTDAIIGNQCKINKVNNVVLDDMKVKFISTDSIGVGHNRNLTLMNATADICILADDDMEFVDDYKKLVEKAFFENPEANIIVFNLLEDEITRYQIKKKMKVKTKNYMRFGAGRIAFRKNSIIKHNIFFTMLFGGGTKFGGGEDTIFLRDCLRNKLKIVGLPLHIAKLKDDRPSTWYEGRNEKLLIERGALFAALSRKFAKLFCIQYLIRKRKWFKDNFTFFEAYKLMKKGIKKFNEF